MNKFSSEQKEMYWGVFQTGRQVRLLYICGSQIEKSERFRSDQQDHSLVELVTFSDERELTLLQFKRFKGFELLDITIVYFI